MVGRFLRTGRFGLSVLMTLGLLVVAFGAAVPVRAAGPDNFTVNFSPVNDGAIQPEVDKIYLGNQTASDGIKAMQPKVEKLIADTAKDAGASG